MARKTPALPVQRARPPRRQYAAFLRGVSPTNVKMAELKLCFESAGFTEVKTLLTSGNVVFSAAPATEQTLERRAEAAMLAALGRSFLTIVRSIAALRALLEADPYSDFGVSAAHKRVVTFLRRAPTNPPSLPVELDGARMLRLTGRELFSAYVPNERGPIFMKLIENTVGREVTTRTWDTVKKVCR